METAVGMTVFIILSLIIILIFVNEITANLSKAKKERKNEFEPMRSFHGTNYPSTKGSYNTRVKLEEFIFVIHPAGVRALGRKGAKNSSQKEKEQSEDKNGKTTHSERSC